MGPSCRPSGGREGAQGMRTLVVEIFQFCMLFCPTSTRSLLLMEKSQLLFFLDKTFFCTSTKALVLTELAREMLFRCFFREQFVTLLENLLA